MHKRYSLEIVFMSTVLEDSEIVHLENALGVIVGEMEATGVSVVWL